LSRYEVPPGGTGGNPGQPPQHPGSLGRTALRDALRERAQDPGTEDRLAALIAVNKKLQASGWSLPSRTHALLGQDGPAARTELYALIGRYEDLRRVIEANSAAIEQALGY